MSYVQCQYNEARHFEREAVTNTAMSVPYDEYQHQEQYEWQMPYKYQLCFLAGLKTSGLCILGRATVLMGLHCNCALR